MTALVTTFFLALAMYIAWLLYFVCKVLLENFD